MRWVLFIVVNGLGRFDELRAGAEWLARIQVPVKAREIAAGNLNPDFMAGQKSVACHPQVDFITVNLAG